MYNAFDIFGIEALPFLYDFETFNIPFEKLSDTNDRLPVNIGNKVSAGFSYKKNYILKKIRLQWMNQ